MPVSAVPGVQERNLSNLRNTADRDFGLYQPFLLFLHFNPAGQKEAVFNYRTNVRYNQ